MRRLPCWHVRRTRGAAPWRSVPCTPPLSGNGIPERAVASPWSPSSLAVWSSEHRAVRHRRRQLRLGGNLCHTSCDELCHWARDVTPSPFRAAPATAGCAAATSMNAMMTIRIRRTATTCAGRPEFCPRVWCADREASQSELPATRRYAVTVTARRTAARTVVRAAKTAGPATIAGTDGAIQETERPS